MGYYFNFTEPNIKPRNSLSEFAHIWANLDNPNHTNLKLELQFLLVSRLSGCNRKHIDPFSSGNIDEKVLVITESYNLIG